MNIQSEAERIFEGAAFFNKWLKELTESEKEIVQQMIELSATYEQERSKVLREALEKINEIFEAPDYGDSVIKRYNDIKKIVLAARTEGDGKEIKGNDGVLYDALLEAYDSKPPLQKNPFQSIGDRNRLIVIFRKHGLVITKIPSPPKTT
jgi:hypothetical protein